MSSTAHPFHPDDFPLNKEIKLNPTQIFFLKGCVHFKTDAKILDLSGQTREPFNDFSHAFIDEVSQVSQKLADRPRYEIGSCGNMMRTIKTLNDSKSGEKLCDLNITFVSFGASSVRFPNGSKHSRHEIELSPVGGSAGFGGEQKHEAFVRHSVPYFWDMSDGRVGVLYKALNQKRVEVAKVTGFGFDKDAVLVLNGEEVDDVVAISTCIILLNGRDAMDH